MVTSDEPNDDQRARRTLRLVLVAALLHGLAYLILLPPWMGEDEPWHVEYAHYIGLGYLPFGGEEISSENLETLSASQVQVLRELGGVEEDDIRATQLALLDSMREHHFWERVDWAASGSGAESFDQLSPYFTATHQPPLYYLLTGQVLRLFGGGDVLREMWLLRGLSLLFYLAVVRAAWEVGRRLSSDLSLALGCALVAAWWPMHARQAAVVNNDVLVKVFTAWSLVVALDLARHGLTRARLGWAALLVALGLLSKTTGAGALVPLGLALLWRVGGVRLGERRARSATASASLVSESAGSVEDRSAAMPSPGFAGRRALLVVGLLVLAALVPLGYLLSNNPAIPLTLGNFQERLHRAVQPAFWAEFGRTAVGAFNWYSRDLPPLVHAAVGYALALCGAGLVWALARRSDVRRGLLLLCVAAVAGQLALVLLRGTAAGRYVMPQLVAFAALVTVGALAPLPERWRPKALVALAGALLLFDAAFLWSGLVWNQYGVWGS